METVYNVNNKLKFLETKISIVNLYTMISAHREILTIDNGFLSFVEQEKDGFERTEYWDRHSFHSKCKICPRRFLVSLSREMVNKTLCVWCSSRVPYEFFKYYERLEAKRTIMKTAIPDLLLEIQEFGLRPDRVYQTQLFEHYNFKDLLEL